MPPARPDRCFRRCLRRALLATGLAGLLAGCSFPEGPDWPPLTPQEAAGEAPLSAAAAAAGETGGEAQAAADPKWPSLAELTRGTPAATAPGGGALLVGLVRPLVVIRFAGQAVDYETTLYETVKSALVRRPQTAFDLVAVAPGLAAADRAVLSASARSVARSLSEMGLPAERLSLSATSYPGVVGSEVHLYVR